ncbi:unnamed protein product [Lota lota]
MERKTSLFVWCVGLLSHVAAIVPPATNVSLDCRNFQNTLRWDYSQHASLKPQFRVNVRALSGKQEQLLVDYPNLQCDLSAFSQPDTDYIVSVTALVGQNESLRAPARGWIFSYFYGSAHDQMCSLDLPPVNVTIQSEAAGIKLRFSHPSVLYRHKLLTKSKRQQRNPNDGQAENVSEFSYTVTVNSDKEYPYSCEKDVCEQIIPVGLQKKRYCVKINGEWEKVAVHSTQDYCAQAVPPPTPSYKSLYIGLGAFFSLAFLVLLFAFCFKKVTGFSPIPVALSFAKNEHGLQRDLSCTPLIPDQASVSPVAHVGRTITAAEKEHERPLPTGVDPAAEARDAGPGPVAAGVGPRAGDDPGVAARDAGQGHPGMEPRAGDDPGVAARDAGQGHPGMEPRAGDDPGVAARDAGQGDPGMEPRAGDDPGVAARDAGQGHPGMEPRAGDDPGVAAGDVGPGQLDAGAEEGAPEAEPLGEALNASGYEQREKVVRVEISPGDTIDAYHC